MYERRHPLPGGGHQVVGQHRFRWVARRLARRNCRDQLCSVVRLD